jgi:hypothetical protein
VVGQDRAVDVVSDAVLRSRAGLAARNRGSSFLFLVRRTIWLLGCSGLRCSLVSGLHISLLPNAPDLHADETPRLFREMSMFSTLRAVMGGMLTAAVQNTRWELVHCMQDEFRAAG